MIGLLIGRMVLVGRSGPRGRADGSVDGSSSSPAVPLVVAFVALAGARSRRCSTARRRPAAPVWVRELSLEFLFRLDGFALVMALLVTGIGVVVLVYASAYFADDAVAEPRGPLRRVLHAVRRRDARARRRRRRLDAVRVLGADLGDVVPAHRPRRRARGRPRLGAAGAARHRRRRPGDARRVRLPGERGRHDRPARHARGRADVDDRPGRPRARAGRRVQQVGAVPVPLLAAGRDGRADARQRVPALGDDGQGRRVDRRPLRAGVRGDRAGGGRCSSSSAASRCCSAASPRCGATTPSSRWRSARSSQLGFLVVLFGVGESEATAAGVVAARRPRAVQVRACSSPSARSSTQPAVATCAGSPVSAGRLPVLAAAAGALHAVDDRPAAAARLRSARSPLSRALEHGGGWVDGRARGRRRRIRC